MKHLAVLSLTICLFARAGTAAPAPRALTLAVRVYDQRVDTTVSLREALDEASRVFASAGVALLRAQCGADGSGSEPRCARPIAPDERVIRVMDTEVAGTVSHEPMVLGAAYIDTEAAHGSLATVYGRRVNAWADTARLRRTDTLGRAIAHELGHLILGTHDHSRHGLMRGVWTMQTDARGFGADWTFTPGEAKKLRARVTSYRGGTLLATN
jgi:hypothetical protein